MQQSSIFEAIEHPGSRALPARSSQRTVRLGYIAALLALGGLNGCSGGATDGTPYFGREGSTSSPPSSASASQPSAPPATNGGTSTTSATPSAPPVSSSGGASPTPAPPAAAPSRPSTSPTPSANESAATPTNLAPAAGQPAKPAAPAAAEKEQDDDADEEEGDDHGGGRGGDDDDDAPANSGSGNASAPTGAAPPAAPPAAQTLSFEQDVWPIFNAQCGPCHVSGRSGGQSIGSTNLDTAFADAVRVGRRITSELNAGDMPPACNGGNPGDRGCISSSSDVSTITTWLDQGSQR